MVLISSQIKKYFSLQLFFYLFVNGLFIFKYVSRAGLNPFLVFVTYLLLVTGFLGLYKLFSSKISEKKVRIFYFVLLAVLVILISVILIYIRPLSINVDRWSALTYFWDYFFQGKYPYSAHTHVSVTNFPSPFPMWHVLNLPFYLLGDVGIGLIFFLLLTAFIVYFFFQSYKKSLFFFFLLLMSPAYWWEVIVRSDSINNAWLVFIIILWLEKTKKTISNDFFLIAILCGLVATTRLTAILPLTIYFFKPYLNLNLKQKILFPILILSVSFLVFSPFIFWDTNSWIFFTRNPFMSQADKGYLSILLITIAIGIFISLYWKNIEQFFYYSALFIFIFILFSQFGLFLRSDMSPDFISGNICDISYFNLFFPYCLASLSAKLST